MNKVDSAKEMFAATEFYQLGVEKYYTLSSATGSGTGELLDDWLQISHYRIQRSFRRFCLKLPLQEDQTWGKSTLTNALLDDNRNIVTDIAGYNQRFHRNVYIINSDMSCVGRYCRNA